MDIYYEWDWAEYIARCENEPRPSRYTDSQAKASGGWNGTATYSEAIQLAKDGWTEGRIKLAGALEDANAITRPDVPEYRDAMDVCGYRPDIGLYCAGDPLNMVCSEPVPSKPVIRMGVLIDAPGMTRVDRFLNYGAAVCSYVQQLELAGYRCELTAISITGGSGGRLVYAVRVKEADQPLEIDRLAFAFMNSANSRRLGFAVIEQHKEFSEKVAGIGYGRADKLTKEEMDSPMFKDYYIFEGNTGGSNMAKSLGNLADAVKNVGEHVEKILEAI